MTQEFSDLLSDEISLQVDKFGSPADRDIRIATTTLLVYVAQADGEMHKDELQALMSLLARNFEMTDDDNAHMIQVGEFLCRDEGKFDQFLQIVNEKFEREQLVKIVAMMWRVMEADGVTLDSEQQLINKAISTLKLTQDDLESAKKLVSEHSPG